MRNLTRRVILSLPLVGAVLARNSAGAQTAGRSAVADTDWRYYAGNAASTRYAPLDQINASNFNSLEVAWRFKPDSLGPRPEYQYEATPLVIKGRLYTVAGSRRAVVCLDASNGEMIWMHSENEGARGQNAPRQYSGHGVAYWSDGKEERIIYVTPGYRMIALDARTGVPVKSFGTDGVVDLKLNDDQQIDLVTGEVGLHSTPLVIKDTVVVGAAHLSGGAPRTRKNVKGYARGFDVRTGRRKWIFHTIPRKGEVGYDSWVVPGQAEEAGNTGVWGQISGDAELGLVYLPVELPTGDYNGQYRAGNALFGESIVAVDIKTGVRRWHYQMVHHGLWDYDVPCAAVLCDLPHNGKIIKALAQPTKQAFLFVLNRETGEPIWPIHEKKVIPADVPGEWYSRTQPFPSKPPAFDRQGTSEADLINWTPELHEKAKAVASHYTLGPLYTAPILHKPGGSYGVINLPGYIGGINWPGASYDPETHTLYTYSQTNPLSLGVIVPNLDHKRGEFDYVHANPAPDAPGFKPGDLTVDGLPLFKPPYGRITATNLESGTQSWQIAHGETPDVIRNHPALKGIKIPRTGMIGKIAPLTTKSLVICGDPDTYTDETGRKGARLRAYDKATGEEKGAVFLPGAQSGSPMTYMLGGRQYIVLAIGGRGVPAEFIAYRLPSDAPPRRPRGGDAN